MHTQHRHSVARALCLTAVLTVAAVLVAALSVVVSLSGPGLAAQHMPTSTVAVGHRFTPRAVGHGFTPKATGHRFTLKAVGHSAG